MVFNIEAFIWEWGSASCAKDWRLWAQLLLYTSKSIIFRQLGMPS